MQEDGIINKEEFSLRDKDNLKLLNDVLEDLIEKSDNNLKQFYTVYSELPLYIYNKIDDLRNISYDKKSEEFINVAKKAKYVNKIFHDKFKK